MSRTSAMRLKIVREPRLWVDAVHLRRDDQAVHNCAAPPAAIRPAKQPTLSCQSDSSQASFGGIVAIDSAHDLDRDRRERESVLVRRFAPRILLDRSHAWRPFFAMAAQSLTWYQFQCGSHILPKLAHVPLNRSQATSNAQNDIIAALAEAASAVCDSTEAAA